MWMVPLTRKEPSKSYVELEFKINSRKFREQFYVTGLGKQKIILGFTWLQKYNPLIDWKTGKIEWKDWKFNFRKWFKKPKPKTTMEELPDEEELKNRTLYPTNEDLNALLLELIEESIQINKVTITMELAAEENWKKEEKTDEELVPQEYHGYLDVFSKEKAAWFPESRSGDHKIKIKEGFEPKSFKNYNLTPAEQLELDKFLKENLEKGYIRPSQSPMASPFFFISKKDGKLQPCQDYCYLNNWTIKNSYPLPLISDILDKLKGAKYCTKLDVWWEYNNIRICKGDEWKAAFKTNSHVFRHVQFPCNVSSHDGWHICWNDWWKIGDNLYGQHPHLCQNQGRTRKNYQNGIGQTLRTRSIPESQEVRILQITNWISGYDHWRRENFHGPHQTHWNTRLANSLNGKTS